jgi:hypothetical protein
MQQCEGWHPCLSFKEGPEDTQRGNRHFTNFTIDGFQDWVTQLPGWVCLDAWLTEDMRPDRRTEQWVNGVIRRI